jgi:hypothetical protein
MVNVNVWTLHDHLVTQLLECGDKPLLNGLVAAAWCSYTHTLFG